MRPPHADEPAEKDEGNDHHRAVEDRLSHADGEGVPDMILSIAPDRSPDSFEQDNYRTALILPASSGKENAGECRPDRG